MLSTMGEMVNNMEDFCSLRTGTADPSAATADFLEDDVRASQGVCWSAFCYHPSHLRTHFLIASILHAVPRAMGI